LSRQAIQKSIRYDFAINDFAFSQPATFNIQPATVSRRTESSAPVVVVTMSLQEETTLCSPP
jgi:hypothetical protein